MSREAGASFFDSGRERRKNAPLGPLPSSSEQTPPPALLRQLGLSNQSRAHVSRSDCNFVVRGSLNVGICVVDEGFSPSILLCSSNHAPSILSLKS